MANYANLLATIAANIYTNNNNEVTAAMVKSAVDAMVASLGAGYQFMGVATTATTPAANPDNKQFYIARNPGIYANFGGLEVKNGEIVIFKYDSAWTSDTIDVCKAWGNVLGNPSAIGFPTSGYVRYSDGAIISGGYDVTDYIAVSEGDIFLLYGTASASVAMFSAYTSQSQSGYLQGKSVPGPGGTDAWRMYVVPSGVSYVRVCAYHNLSTRMAFLVKNPGYVLRPELDGYVTAAAFKSVNPATRLYPKTKLPCLSFQFDDCPPQDSTLVALFESYGIPCAFAFIASEANIAAKGAQYLDYQKRGFPIMNHSVDATALTTGNYTYSQALAAVSTALNRIQDAGMRCNGFVCPSSTISDSFKPILALFQAYAFTSATSDPTANGRSADPCDLHRYSMESHTLAEIEQYIDDCVTNDQIATFYGHAANLVSGDTSVWSIAKITAIIEYSIAKRDAGLLYVGGTDDCVKYFFDL